MSQLDLFNAQAQQKPVVPQPAVTHVPGLYRGATTLEALSAELPLEQKTAWMYGKTFLVPRLECWFGPRAYQFGGRVEEPKPWTRLATMLRRRVESTTGEAFDSCFVNLYRSGKDTIPWHADDDDWIGPVIASVTFGASRRFLLRHNETGTVHEYRLGDGDLLVMGAGVQREWQHCVPRTAEQVGPRINLTFRQVVSRA